jgi:hypothetical protein
VDQVRAKVDETVQKLKLALAAVLIKAKAQAVP